MSRGTGAGTGLEPSTRYFSSFVWNTVAKFGDFGLAYLFSVLLARMLAPAGYGAYASILSICTLVFVFTSIGVDNTIHRFVGEASADDEGRRRIPTLVRLLFSFRLVLVALLVTSAFLARGWIADRFADEAVAPLIAAASLYLVTQSLVSFAAAVLTGLLRTRAVAAFTVALRIANLALAYWLLSSGAGVREIMLMLGATSAALFIGYLWKLLPLFRGVATRIDARSVAAFAVIAWGLAVMNFGLGKQSDVILLNAIRHDRTEVALYDVAYTLTQTVAMLLTIGLSGIALTLFSKRHGSRPEGLRPIWKSFVALVGTAVLPLVLFLIVNARGCVEAVYGAEYAAAGAMLPLYAVPMLVNWLLGGGASSTALHAANRIRVVLWIRVATGALNVAVNVLLIRAWGPRGALVGTGVCASAAVALEMTVVRRMLGARVPLRHLVGVVPAALLAALPSFFLKPTGLVALVGHGIVFAAIYVLVLHWTRPLPRLDDGLMRALPGPIAVRLASLTRDST